MTVTATGAMGKALTKLVTHLSNSPTWQAACGVSSAADALKNIYWPWVNFEDVSRPNCIVSQAENYQENRQPAGGSGTILLQTGAIRCFFERDNDDNFDEKDNWILTDNLASGIIADLKEISGVSDNLNIVGVSLEQPHSISHPATVAASGGVTANPKYWQVGFTIQWGAL